MPRRLLLIARSDERVRCVVVLHLSKCEEDLLHDILARTDLNIEVWAFDKSHPGDHASPTAKPAKDLVFSTKIANVQDPFVVVEQVLDNGAEADVFKLLWEVELTLHRPRIRMPDPSLCVRCALQVSNPTPLGTEEVMVEPFKPLEPNLLEAMGSSSADGHQVPYLAASRLEKVVPSTPKTSNQFQIEYMSPKYRVVPVASSRMRYSRLATSSAADTIASLDLEITPFIDLQATIEAIEVDLVSGTIEDLMPGFLPVGCQSRDVMTFHYRLHPATSHNGLSTPITPAAVPNLDILNISIRLRVFASTGRKSDVRMQWSTNVDFFQALNPSYGAPSQPLQRTHRPQTLSLSSDVRQSQTVNTSLQPVLPGASAESLSISFISPAEPVQVGKPFIWQVLVVNRSNKPARLTIIPLPRGSKIPQAASHYQKRHAPKSSTASFHPTERRHVRDAESDVDFAQAVVDENVVYAMQHSSAVPPETDLMSLTAEVRIGPLAPGQCHETQIEMVAFKAGVLTVDAIRVVDNVKETEQGINAAGVVTDIRDLPDIVVKPAVKANEAAEALH